MIKKSLWQVTSDMKKDVLLLAGPQDLHTRHDLTFIQCVW